MLRSAVKNGKLTKSREDELVDRGLAAGVIEAQDAELVKAAIAARRAVIKVDDFSPSYWHKES